MPDQAASTGGMPLPPVIPGGEDVYNQIMSQIEPELVTTVLPALPAKYANETQEERDARMERYKKAFIAYEKAHKEFLMSQESTVRVYKKGVMSAVEKRAGGNDEDAVSNLEAMISNLPQ